MKNKSNMTLIYSSNHRLNNILESKGEIIINTNSVTFKYNKGIFKTSKIKKVIVDNEILFSFETLTHTYIFKKI